ncbi:MAG: acyl-CoA dehydrogenase family protein [Dehalococcoidia bacterium]|nr:acyl-CoA dehydrogenase family protein [Dehalococcoidia bacterium]
MEPDRAVHPQRRAGTVGHRLWEGTAVGLLGPTLILHGTPEQKARYLPAILAGETVWAQGYSEPGAGSDLASLSTRAVRDGDDFVLNGQKIWTSGAHTADSIFALVRTDPDAPKHRGISFLLIEDIHAPGCPSGRSWTWVAGITQRSLLRGGPRACPKPRRGRRTGAGMWP